MVNVTKHAIRFQSVVGEVYEIAPSGVVIDARFQEEVVGTHSSGAQLVRARIFPTPFSGRWTSVNLKKRSVTLVIRN